MIKFTDKFRINKDKTVISVRDGIQEYYGGEIGMMPVDKIFKVYRSADTIKEIVSKLDNLPITNEHIEMDSETVPTELIKGTILSSENVELLDEDTLTTVGIKHRTSIDENMLQFVESGKIEVSLGYWSQLKDSDNENYDLEQFGLIPHHLAIVNRGRCGGLCKIIDNKGQLKMFINEDGTLNIDALQSLMSEMSQVLELMTDEQKADFMALVNPTPEVVEDEEIKEEIADEEIDMEEMKDSAITSFKDSEDFKKILDSYSDMKIEAITKANNWVENYDSKEKSITQIMQDTLAVAKPNVKFEDSELSVAFKMLEQKPNVVISEMKDSNDVWAKYRK